jgi:hypothetical protein
MDNCRVARADGGNRPLWCKVCDVEEQRLSEIRSSKTSTRKPQKKSCTATVENIGISTMHGLYERAIPLRFELSGTLIVEVFPSATDLLKFVNVRPPFSPQPRKFLVER